MELSLEQRRAVAIAKARVKASEKKAPNPLEDAVFQLGAGFNERSGNIMQAPFRAASMVTEPVARWAAEGLRELTGRGPIPEDAVPEHKNRVLGKLGADYLESYADYQPQTRLGRMTRRGGEFIAENLVPAGMAFGAAKQAAADPVKAGLSSGQQMLRNYLQPIANSPGKAAIGETVSSLGAGMGEQIGREVDPDSNIAPFVGGIAGAMTPAALSYMPINVGGRLLRAGMKHMSPASQSKAAARAVSETIGSELRPEMQQNLRQATELEQEIPGFQPSLGEASGSPALLRTQQDIERQASGAELDAFNARREANKQAIEDYSAFEAPEGTNEPLYVIDAAEGRIEGLRGKLSDRQAVLDKRQGMLADRIPEVNRASLGESVREALKGQKLQTSEDMSRVATDLGINDAEVPIAWNDWKKQTLQEFKPKSAFEDISNYPEVLGDIKKIGQDAITFQDFKALRERLTDDIIDTMASPKGRTKRLRQLIALKQRVDDLGDTFLQASDPELADNYRQFREIYKREFVDRFEKGAAIKTLQKDGRGFYRLPDEEVADAFLAPGDISGARQFKKIFGDTQNASVEASLMDSLRSAAVRDDKVDPKLFDAWLRRHGSVLDEFPGIKQKITDYRGAVGNLLERQVQLDVRNKRIQDSMLARELQGYERGSKNAEAIIANAIKEPRKMQSLLRSVKDNPAALQALKRNVWQQADIEDPKAMFQFIEANKKSLGKVLGMKHLSNLRNIQIAREILSRSSPQGGQPISPNVLKEVEKHLGMGVNQLQSRIFAAESGRTSWRFIGVDALSRFIRGHSKNEVAELFKEAMYNPQVAQDMADMIFIKQKAPQKARRLNTWLLNLGVSAGQEE